MRLRSTELGKEARTGHPLAEALARRMWPLESNALVNQARKSAGHSDFGEPRVSPALSILAESLDCEANLHPLGRFLMRAHLTGLLTTRLRLVNEWRNPDRPCEPVRVPLFITGMPRSGSTFLHELLAQDPALRVPRVWEVMFPLKTPVRTARDPRIRKTAACLWLFRRIARRADAVHPLRAETPQECVAIHSYALLSEEFLTTCRVPAYESFLHAADLIPAYAWQRRFLQHLQSGEPARRWVLKSPDHAYGLDAIFSVFPDARIVQTHRNPADVLKSSIELVDVLQRTFARPRDRREHGLREARMLAEAMERLMQFRERRPDLEGRFLDLSYSELVGDPMAAVGRIYRHAEMELSAVAAEAMRRLVGARSRYPHRHRRASLADLGIDERAEAPRFRHYCFRFGIPWQSLP